MKKILTYNKREKPIPFTPEEKKQLKQQLEKTLAEKLPIFAAKLGVTYNKVRVNFMRSASGLCYSGSHDLVFNPLLAAAPVYVQEGIMCHELCHIIEPNHSKNFYKLVRSLYPYYSNCEFWLKNELGGVELWIKDTHKV